MILFDHIPRRLRPEFLVKQGHRRFIEWAGDCLANWGPPQTFRLSIPQHERLTAIPEVPIVVGIPTEGEGVGSAADPPLVRGAKHVQWTERDEDRASADQIVDQTGNARHCMRLGLPCVTAAAATD